MASATSSRLVFRLPLALVLLLIVGTLPSPSTADQVLYPGYTLLPQQTLDVANYVLIMQNDCNLVLYDSGRAVWASGTNGRGSNCRVTMQRDANLVIYDGSGRSVWASNTARATGNYALVLQRDRNLVIYGTSIWATGTNGAGLNTLEQSGPGLIHIYRSTDGEGAGTGSNKNSSSPSDVVSEKTA